jgi:hypothetical protein
MAKKAVAAMADLVGANDKRSNEKTVKFISTFPAFHFMIDSIGPDGKRETHTDADGNNKLPSFRQYEFARVAGHRDSKTGKINPDTAFSFFIADPEKHGRDFQLIVDKLTELSKNALYKVYSEDDYFKLRNPEAYRIAVKNAEYETTIEDLKKKNEDLERRLGFKK